MKREFLKEMGLSDEQIENIMSEHGRTVNDMKSNLEAATNNLNELQATITERDKQLEDLQKKAGDNEDMKATIATLKQQNDAEKQALLDKMNRQTLDFAVDRALLTNRVRVPRGAVMAVLENPEAIQLGQDGSVIGLNEQLEKAKAAYPFMFEDETPAAPATTPAAPGGYNPGPPNQRTNQPGNVDPAELGKMKAMERHGKKEEAKK